MNTNSLEKNEVERTIMKIVSFLLLPVIMLLLYSFIAEGNLKGITSEIISTGSSFPFKENEKKMQDVSVEKEEKIKWTRNLKDAMEKSRESNLPIYVVITAPTWCGACKFMERETFSKNKVIEVVNENFIPLQILDGAEDEKKFEIEGYPTSFVLNQKGEIQNSSAGGMDAKSFLAYLAPYMKIDKDSKSNLHIKLIDKKPAFE